MKVVLTFGFIAATLAPGVYGDSITIDSGTGVTFLDGGSSSTDCSAPFTAASFLAAQTGANAALLSSHPFYIASLPAAPAADWIGPDASAGISVADTALYAISFDVPDAFVSGSLTLDYAVDNELGRTNAGIYINGIALSGSTGIGGFSSQNVYTNVNIGPDLVQGTNWLYLDAVNLGAEAGLIFSANISTVDSTSTIPEPATVLLLGAGLSALGAMRRKLFGYL